MEIVGGDLLNSIGRERAEPLPELLARYAAYLRDLWSGREDYAAGLEQLSSRRVEKRLQREPSGLFYQAYLLPRLLQWTT
jgi:hypothetical protein